MFSKLKQKIIDWCFCADSIKISDLYVNPQKVDIDSINERSKFIGQEKLNDVYVKSDIGFVKVKSILKTKKYKEYKSVFTNGSEIITADKHKFISVDNNEIYAKDLKIDNILSETGVTTHKHTKVLQSYSNMYDLELCTHHKYYTNGVLSHNTTIAAVYILWYMLFNKNKSIAILGNKEETSREIMDRLREAYEMLPLWMQPGILTWNKKSIKLSNKSKAFTAATTPSGIRGKSINFLLLDEFAFVDSTIAEPFMASVFPVISSGQTGRICVVSTPNGTNHFYDIWRKAIMGKGSFKPIRVHWNEIPGRDEAWKEMMISDIGLMRFNQEYGGEFLGSSATLISGKFLEEQLAEHVDDEHFKSLKTGKYKVWKEPAPGKRYVVGVDTADGIGKDYSVIQVLDISDLYKIEQVAIYVSNDTKPIEFSQLIKEISIKYNNAPTMIENNNRGGGRVTYWLWYELDFENMVNVQKKEKGITASTKTKSMACTNMQTIFETKRIIIRDRQTVNELLEFEDRGDGYYSAKRGKHDDRVMSLLWALYYMETKQFEHEDTFSHFEKTTYDPLFGNDNDDDLNIMLPFGYTD